MDAFGAASIPGALLFWAFLLISCKPSTDGSEPEKNGGNGGDTEVKPVFTMTYDAGKQWAAPTFAVEADWSKLDVEFDKDYSEAIQFCCISDKVEKEEEWGTAYYSFYPGATVKTSIDIAAVLDLENDDGKTLTSFGATKIVKISIQNKTKDAQTVNVLSAKVTKADGSVIDVVPEGDWGSKVTTN